MNRKMGLCFLLSVLGVWGLVAEADRDDPVLAMREVERAWKEWKRGAVGEAGQRFQRATSLWQGHADAWYGRALVAFRRDELEESWYCLQAALRRAEAYDTYLKQARVQTSMKVLDAARMSSAEASEINDIFLTGPGNCRTGKARAYAEGKSSRADTLRRGVTMGASVENGWWKVHALAGEVALRLGNAVVARQNLQEAIQAHEGMMSRAPDVLLRVLLLCHQDREAARLADVLLVRRGQGEVDPLLREARRSWEEESRMVRVFSRNLIRFRLPTDRTGNVAVNAWWVGDRDEGVGILVDPGRRNVRLEEVVAEWALPVNGIVLTHGHEDHVGGALWYGTLYQVPLWMPWPDRHLVEGELGRQVQDLAGVKGHALVSRVVRDVMPVPGHTPGSCLLLTPWAVLVGDVVFADDLGRVAADGDEEETKVLERIAGMVGVAFRKLPATMPACPGHGAAFSVGELSVINPWFVPRWEDGTY